MKFLIFFLFTQSLFALDLIKIQELLSAKQSEANLEQNEKLYQRLVQKQTFSDLLELYDPKNQDKVQTTYASFTAVQESEKSDDLGTGLHVVKRLTLPLANGKTKVVDVNEQWGHNAENDGLFLPDEIRIKTLIFEGERFVPGSEKLYLYDQIRIAWGPEGQVAILRQAEHTYDAVSKRNLSKRMRAAVSAPYSCMLCHDGSTGFEQKYLKPGEKQNYEAIVQDSHFKLPVTEMNGFKEYMDYLGRVSKDKNFIEKVSVGLAEPSKTFAVPGLSEALTLALKTNSIQWLAEDALVSGSDYASHRKRQGVYSLSNGSLFIEAIEDIFEGKYRWWDPQTILP